MAFKIKLFLVMLLFQESLKKSCFLDNLGWLNPVPVIFF